MPNLLACCMLVQVQQLLPLDPARPAQPNLVWGASLCPAPQCSSSTRCA